MAMSTMGIINKGSSLLFLTLLSLMRPSQASGFEVFARSDSCPTSYNSCGTDVPSDFCCSSSTSCLVVENATTIICCPSGSSCESINPITCDIQQQNSTAHPKAAIMTTLLDESLPKCGDSCCPFGYSCSGGYCYLNKNETAASTSTSTSSASSNTGSSTTTDTNAASSTSTSSPSSTASATGTDVTPIPSSISESSESTLTPSAKSTTSSEYPSKAIAVGFFPGVLFGAMLALLISTCLRRRTERQRAAADTQDPKGGRSWSISSPIASEEESYRTDFLLRDKHASMSSKSMRSMLNRSGTRVRSLFSNGPPRLDKDVPPLPTQNATELPTPPEPAKDPVTPPRQREPSTESIKVYSPPGAFAQSRRFLGPEPYPSRIARPSTTFEDLVQAVGFDEKEAKANKYFKVHQVRKIT